MDHPFGIVPASPDPAPYKAIKILYDTSSRQFFRMAAWKSLRFSKLFSQDQRTGLWIEQKAPVVDLLHVNGLRPGIDPHDLWHNRYFFYRHPSKLS